MCNCIVRKGSDNQTMIIASVSRNKRFWRRLYFTESVFVIWTSGNYYLYIVSWNYDDVGLLHCLCRSIGCNESEGAILLNFIFISCSVDPYNNYVDPEHVNIISIIWLVQPWIVTLCSCLIVLIRHLAIRFWGQQP